MSLIQQYLNANPAKVNVSNEEHVPEAEPLEVEVPEVVDVTEDELHEAEDFIEEVEDERQAAMVEDERREQTLEEAQAITASVENYIDVLTVGIEKGEFSPQFAAIAGSDLKRYNVILGGSDDGVPSFEDFNHDNLEEFYTESLEGFKDIAGKVKDIASKVGNSLTMFTSGFAGNAKEAAALNTRADALMGKINQSGMDQVEVPIKKLGSVFSHNGELPSNILGALSSDQKALKQIYDVVMVGNAKYYEEGVAAMEKALENKSDGKATINAYLSKSTPVAKLPSTIKTPTALLGVKVIDTKIEGERSAKAIAELLKKEEKLFTSVDNASGNISINKAQVTGLLKAAKTYASMLNDLNKSAKTSLDIQTKLNNDLLQAAKSTKISPAKAVAWITFTGYYGIYRVVTKNSDGNKTEDELAIKQAADVVRQASKSSKGAFETLSKQLSRNAKACLQLAERAMGAKGKEVASDAE